MNAKTLILAVSLIVGTVVKAGPGSDVPRTDGGVRSPVLLELFTSEGCSSCPPADKLLQKLDRAQSVEGADLIVLSEHVDYWNEGGWVDPYSSPQFSKRQREYASLLDSDVYTPQLVVDGKREMVGSDRAAINHAIEESVRTPKTPVVVHAQRSGNDVTVHVEVGTIAGHKAAAVYLVLAADQARSHVMGGENAGRELEHVAVVQSLVKIADVSSGAGVTKDVRLNLPAIAKEANLRVAVLVQEDGSKHVIGAGEDRL